MRESRASDEDMHVIEEWRAAHSSVINTFQALPRNRAKDFGARVIQRHKRNATIGTQLELLGFGTQEEALNKLFELENERPGADVVYVPGSTTDEIRSAYKNYYDDARDFLSWVGEGSEFLRYRK